jgi:hypothetical protein
MGAANILAFGMPESTEEDRRLQHEAAAKKIPATQPTSAAAAPPPPKEPGAAVGPETLKTENAGADEKPSSYYDRVKAVKMPDGRIVFTNVPKEYTAKGAEYQDYGAAVSEVSGRPWTGGANVVDVAGGMKAYVQPGQEGAVAKAIPQPVPELEDALPELTDPQAIYERRDYLKRRAGEEFAARQAGSDLTKSEAEASTAVAASQLDPMAKARMEAEARYGGDVIKAESDAQRTALAIGMLNKINEEMTRLRKTIPPGPERDAALAELEENRKLYLIAVRPEAASGLMRPDPYAAFGAPSAATPATQPK